MDLQDHLLGLVLKGSTSLGTFGSNNSDDWAPFVAAVSRQTFIKGSTRSILQTRCCVLMLDLDDAEDLVCDMFRLCFLIIR